MKLSLENLKCRDVGCSSSSSGKNNDGWYMPSIGMKFINKRHIFHGFALNVFVNKLVIGVCEFYELDFDVWMWMGR